MSKIVIALSGGMDSATLLGVHLHEGKEVHCCIFKYPSKHNVYEVSSAIDIARHYQNLGLPVHYKVIDLSNVFKLFDSNLLMTGGDIPEGHYQQENMKLTVVPGRNAIFIAIMAGYAESHKIPYISLGVHSGDHAIYPDCRNDFIESMGNSIHLSSGESVYISTPFIDISKKRILEIGMQHEVPYRLTRTCYKDQEKSCGKCGSCNERLEAFAELNLKDPIEYD